MGATARMKPSALRVPRKKYYTLSTIRTCQSKCRSEIRRHHEMMKHDPERLTTEFLIEITNCNCKRKKQQKGYNETTH